MNRLVSNLVIDYQTKCAGLISINKINTVKFILLFNSDEPVGYSGLDGLRLGHKRFKIIITIAFNKLRVYNTPNTIDRIPFDENIFDITACNLLIYNIR